MKTAVIALSVLLAGAIVVIVLLALALWDMHAKLHAQSLTLLDIEEDRKHAVEKLNKAKASGGVII